MWIFTHQFGFPSSLAWSPGLTLVPLLLCFLVHYQYGDMRIYICAHGLLYLQHKKRESIRWNEVRRVHQYSGGGRGNWPYIRLISLDERQFEFAPPDHNSQLLTTLQAKGTQYGFEVIRK